MNLAQLEVALAAYIDNEIVPAMVDASPLKKIGIAAVIAQAKSSGFIDRYFKQMSANPVFNALGIISADGKIGDVNAICDSLKTALKSTGDIIIPFIDIKINADDIDVLRKYLTETGRPSRLSSSVIGQEGIGNG